MDIRRKEQNERRAKTQIQGNLFSSHCGKQIMEQEETLVVFFDVAERLAKNTTQGNVYFLISGNRHFLKSTGNVKNVHFPSSKVDILTSIGIVGRECETKQETDITMQQHNNGWYL